MKNYILLIFVSVFFAFWIGRTVSIIPQSLTFNKSQLEELVGVINKFQQNYSGELLEFSKLYRNSSQENLLLDRMTHSSHDEKIDCKSSLYKFKYLAFLKKDMIWEAFRCGVLKELPINFFSRPPYLYKNGMSFSYMAINNIPFAFDFDQKQKMYPFMKRKELILLNSGNGKIKDETLKFLISLKEKDIEYILSREFIFFTENYIFVKKDVFLQTTYAYFRREDLREFLEGTQFSVAMNLNKTLNCLVKTGNICWRYNYKTVLKLMKNSHFALLLLGVFLVFSSLSILLYKLFTKNREENKRKLALQILAHEIRTPVTSMLILLENMMGNIESYSDASKGDLLKISDEVHRLKRLVDKSKDYLQSLELNKNIQFNFNTINNIKELFSSLCDSFEKYNCEFEFKGDPYKKLRIDVYWLILCLKNLIENASVHGVPPIIFRLITSDNAVFFIVEDGGKCDLNLLKKMVMPFSKGEKSSGSGLGLNIVKSITEQMGGQFIVKSNPTQFILKFRIQNV